MGARMTIGQLQSLLERYRILAASLMIWFVAGNMKSEYCISAIGFMPAMAAPIATPAMADSASGVSSARSSPNCCCSPLVVPNTPPFKPTSSPSRNTSRSRSISSFMATRIASIYSITGIASASPFVFGVDISRGVFYRLERRLLRVVRRFVDHRPLPRQQFRILLLRPQTVLD
jgi:hypothetical protein